ncbi:hypothetical protein PT974_10115 [Cladobotryum mycophilum]|uniref:NAD(P)-binding domain-containing protein n=1 Tax=Cladobotryum mycophilum TaxID=491253 RepID=A0ABR0S8Z0_9HYPO
MKLIIAGGTGFVAKELTRQALRNPAVTSIVALGRRETILSDDVASNTDATKLTSVVVPDFENYSDAIKQELNNCLPGDRTIAVTPSQLKNTPWEDVVRICKDYTLAGLETIAQLPRDGAKPLRFIYISGSNAERDQTKKPFVLADYVLMRGETENRVLAYAKEHSDKIEAFVAKPGLIQGDRGAGATTKNPGLISKIMQTVITTVIGLPKVEVGHIAATLLKVAIDGSDQETLLNDDMTRIGKEFLAEQE